MSKTKEKTGPAEPSFDYQQLAEHMLGSWQEQWRQFATNKDNPFTSGYGDWVSTWSSAMTGWAPPATGAASPASAAGPRAEPSAEETTPNAASHTHKPATTTTNHAGATPSVPPAAAPPSSARDVLLTELARRVEFLHERVVSLEAELDKIKCGK